MLDGISETMSLGAYVPWAFLFATALLATCFDTFSKRAFHPVVLCVWFFGLAFSGSFGAWGAAEVSAAFICLVTPHMLICTMAPRLAARAEDQDETDHTETAETGAPAFTVPGDNQADAEPAAPVRRAA